ncbi:MAG: hypothetical protein MK108_19150 [Mariniblastus sp.]|nr:hypothetical protein [Mariniblastus sp.]
MISAFSVAGKRRSRHKSNTGPSSRLLSKLGLLKPVVSTTQAVKRCTAAWRCPCLVGVALLVGAVGCGGPVTSVKGQVRYEGSPVTRGVISITPVGGRGKSEGSKVLDGAFEIPSIEPGSKQISVIGVMGEETEVDQPLSSEDKLTRAAPSKRGPVQIPTNAVGNGQTIMVNEGPQEINILLSKPDSK